MKSKPSEMIVRQSVRVEVIEVRTNEAAGTTHVESIEKTVETVHKETLEHEESADTDNLKMDDSEDFEFDQQSTEKPDISGEPTDNIDQEKTIEQPETESDHVLSEPQDDEDPPNDDDESDMFLEDEEDSIDPNA
jgi:hypothetical protein